MKFLFLLLVPVLSFAHVGDSASYLLTLGSESVNVKFSVTNYNADTDKYTVESIASGGFGDVVKEIKEVSSDEIMNHDKAIEILVGCELIGGTRERIGKLNTCKLNIDTALEVAPNGLLKTLYRFGSSTVWISDVSVYGFAKLQTEEGAIFELKSYTFTN